MIGVIDTGLSNIQSIKESFKLLGEEPQVFTVPDRTQEVVAWVLPGVGTFKDGMQALKDNDWTDFLKEEILIKKKPLLGICLGMQLLASGSTEYGSCEGLGFVEGKVIQLKPQSAEDHLPHMGWCDVQHRDGRVSCYYFAHSFHLVLDDVQYQEATFVYANENVTAAVSKKNIYGIQFHPEKSQEEGLKVLKCFLDNIQERKM